MTVAHEIDFHEASLREECPFSGPVVTDWGTALPGFFDFRSAMRAAEASGMRGLPCATILPSQTPAIWEVTIESRTRDVKKFSLMISAPKATDASTMPGPPRAFMARARLTAA